MSNRYPIFDGQAQIEIVARTPAVTSEARRIMKLLALDENETHAADIADASLWCFLIAATVSIEFYLEDNAAPPLLMFREWWQETERRRPVPIEITMGAVTFRVPAQFHDETAPRWLWESWQLLGANAVWSEWVKCWNMANMRFTGDKSLLPPSMLTPDEQGNEELKKSD